MDSNSIFLEDLIVEILTRLPAKSLHRFKCVSKRWLSLITSPHFLKAYLTLSPPSWLVTHRHPRVLGPDSGPDLGPYAYFSSSLTEPPNISYLTVTGFPRRYVHPEPSLILTSSNDLVLLLSPRPDFFWVVNPVTSHTAVLPIPSGVQITEVVTGICMAAKFTSSYEDVSLVVMVPQAPKDHTEKEGTLLVYRSDTEKWETKAAVYTAGCKRRPHLWKAYTCFEAGGRLFWVKWSCGLIVIDDPFSERMDLRFIPLPEKGHKLPNGSPLPRNIYPAEGLVHYYPMGGRGKVWRLTDVKKGEWGVTFKAKIVAPPELLKGMRLLPLTAFHPIEDEVSVLMVEEKSFLFNMKESKLVGFGTCPAPDAGSNKRPYQIVVLPLWPSPLPKRLEATSFKAKGNFHFENLRFKDAIYCYSRSIRCFPTAAAYADRAAAHLELGKYQETEIDCSEALKLDNQYMKAYADRASARKELGKLLEAKEDVEIGLKLDSGPHQGLLKLFSEINCLLEKETGKGEEDGGL